MLSGVGDESGFESVFTVSATFILDTFLFVCLIPFFKSYYSCQVLQYVN